MSRFLQDITSVYWWVSVVVIGIVINVVGVLISRKLDIPLSKASSWWRDRSQKRMLEAEQEIVNLKSSQHEQVMMALQVVDHKSSQLSYGLLGIGFLAVGGGFFGYGAASRSILILIWGGFLTLIGMVHVFTAIRHALSAFKKSRWIASARESETSRETPG